MPGHSDILYGSAYRQTMGSKSEPLIEWHEAHHLVLKRLRRMYGLTPSQASNAVITFRQWIIDKESDGLDADKIADELCSELRFRGDV